MAMTADHGFSQRVARIKAGKQWAPEGVLMPDRRKQRRRVDINRGSRRMTVFLSVTVMSGIWIAFSNLQLELAGEIFAHGSSMLIAALEKAANG